MAVIGCRCRKQCKCWLSTRPTSTLGTRTGRRRCTWRLRTRQWSVRRSSSPCWAASTSLTEAGGRPCTTRLSMATLRRVVCDWSLVCLLIFPAQTADLLWPCTPTATIPASQPLSKLCDRFPTCRNESVAGKYLCRASVQVMCARRLGELAVPPALAARGCPWLFGAWRPAKRRVAEWKEGKTGGFISCWRNVQLCEIQPVCFLN